MLRLPLLLLALCTLAACDLASDDDPLFVPGEVLVDLKAGVHITDFRTYVEADADLTWHGTVAGLVLLGVPDGEEEAQAERLETEASDLVASAQPNYIGYLDDV